MLNITDNKKVLIKGSETLILANDLINIEYDINTESNILILCDFNNALTLNETGHIDNSIVKINYLMLDNYDLVQNTKIDVGQNATLNVNTTYLGVNNKKVIFDLFNNKSDSVVEISNNIVCLDEASFSLDCIGTIVKGAKRSKCHQKSHCLTIDNPKLARVLPVLNIDENDVEASHSLSSGTIDEEILFYMNTRGLDSKSALNLILKSYLMPNDNYYDDFIDGNRIKEMAINKVDQLCSM